MLPDGHQYLFRDRRIVSSLTRVSLILTGSDLPGRPRGIFEGSLAKFHSRFFTHRQHSAEAF
jgi:hypothetical protein